MSVLLRILAELTIAGSVVVVGLSLLKPYLSRAFPAKSYYLISKTALLFYLLPFVFIIQRLPISPPEVKSGIQGSPDLGIAAVHHNAHLSAEIGLALFVIWALGVVVFAAWHIYCFHKLNKTLKIAGIPVPHNSEPTGLLAAYQRRLGISGRVKLAYHREIASPVVVGLFRPVILLPGDHMSDLDIGMVIHHELIHLKRKDLWVKLLVLIANAIHWFNPFIYKLRQDIHIWSELSCDEEVVKEMSYAERKRYGEMILRLLERASEMPAAFSASLSQNGRQLKQRLVRLLNVQKSGKVSIGITLATVVATGWLGTTTAAWAVPYMPPIQSVTSEETVSASTQPVVQEETVISVSDLMPEVEIHLLEQGNLKLRALEISGEVAEPQIVQIINLQEPKTLEKVQTVAVPSRMQED